MKKYIIIIIGLILITSSVNAQTFEMRTYLNDYDYIAVQLRQTALGGEPDALSSADGITDLTFTLRWLQSLGDVDADLICTNYNITESGTRTTQDTYYYQKFGVSLALLSPDNYVLNQWVTIATLQSTFTGSTSGTFELAPDGWAGSLIVTIDWDNAGSSTQYNPTLVTGACDNTPVPTVVYDLVWTGATDAYWDKSTNWETACGGTGTIPNTGNNCIIPVVATVYPSDFFAASFSNQPTCDFLRVSSGASLTLKDVDALVAQLTYTVNNDLLNYGTVTIIPNGQLTVDGATHIENANGLVVQATASGVGSFVNDLGGPGTPITYGTNGTAKVQTYLTNGALVNSFYMHTVGPTLDEENYTGPTTGAFLQAFDVAPGNTFAYTFNEATGLWVNQTSYTYPVQTTNGLGMSTDDATAYTMNMSGELIGGDVMIPAPLTFGGSNYELVSNPWPSAFEFDAFFASGINNTVILGKNWIWDASAGNYIAYVVGSSGMVQVGQGFFVETVTPGGPLTFFNTNRNHSNTPFRDVQTNTLSLKMTGGSNGFKDQLVIRFGESATNGYDMEIEAIKWNSMYSNATQIRSIAGDGTELSINVLPTLDLQGEMVSVPVSFQCGYEGEYTFTASDLESFEYGTEIWIEDKQDGNSWHHLSPGHDTYTFTASPDDATDRFIVHFFGPTGVDEMEAKNVLIYADHEYAMVRNMTKNEVIEEVYIYSLAGNMIMHKQVPEQNIYRFFVSNHDNYYIVRVVTDKSTYTEKVFVH